MTLTAKIRAWFKKEPKAPEIVIFNCKGCNLPRAATMLDKYFLCSMCQPKPAAIVVPSGVIITKTLDCYRMDYEQAKAAYEEALLKELAGLKEGEEK